jgi:hypothetical protein
MYEQKKTRWPLSMAVQEREGRSATDSGRGRREQDPLLRDGTPS